MNKIILGTVQMGIPYGINNALGKISSVEIEKILDLAYANEIRYLDTAEAYGTAMEEIGNYHSKSPNKFNVINKFFQNKNNIGISENIKTGLEKVKLEFFEAYLFHDFNDIGIMRSFIHQKNEGKIIKIGVSVYTNDQFEKAINIPEIDVIQFPFNLLDNCNLRLSTMQLAKQANKELHTRSVFLQGLFFMSFNNFPPKLSPLKPYLKHFSNLAKKYQTTIGEMALQYPLTINEIDFVILGIDSVEQLKENIRISKLKMNPELINEIHTINVKEAHLLNPVNW